MKIFSDKRCQWTDYFAPNLSALLKEAERAAGFVTY
jgi:hypothetical protein